MSTTLNTPNKTRTAGNPFRCQGTRTITRLLDTNRYEHNR
jgi:hypothetical protein